jgi:hypothetical protein
MGISKGWDYYNPRIDLCTDKFIKANVLISKDCVLKIADFGTSSLKEYTLAFATTGKKPGMTIRWTASY